MLLYFTNSGGSWCSHAPYQRPRQCLNPWWHLQALWALLCTRAQQKLMAIMFQEGKSPPGFNIRSSSCSGESPAKEAGQGLFTGSPGWRQPWALAGVSTQQHQGGSSSLNTARCRRVLELLEAFSEQLFHLRWCGVLLQNKIIFKRYGLSMLDTHLH